MPGNSQRRGAVRKGGKKPAVGSGGQRRRGLEGRGPTPKATEREYHAAHKRGSAGKGAGAGGSSGSGSGGVAGRGGSRSTRRPKGSSEMVYGRNSVVEALRANVPVSTMYLANRIDTDDRVRESLKLATERGLAILETPRGELDRLTDGGVHQGLALQVPPYEYAETADLIDPERPGIPLVVALDGITDPRNLGAIIRSVAAFGGHGVIVPERRSVGLTASAWKTSAGAAARIPVAKASNLTRALEDFKKAGF
ncbi:MAG: RNA methyltransferase, partial [Humibacillus sp.]